MTDTTLPDLIETSRLLLRPFEIGDVDDVFAYARDPEWSRFLRLLPRPYEAADAERFIARQILRDRAVHPSWAVVDDGTVVGGVNLRFDTTHRLAELGYSIARSRWNQGYCSEAARSVIDAAFERRPNLNRIHARADSDNDGSQRVMEKIGMTREGVLRSSRVERGEVYDEVWYAILRTEWEASVAP